jgi:hypothetical protein
MPIATLLALSQFFFWSYPVDWQMNQQNVVIRGTVVDEASGLPVPGATVSATSAAFDARTVSDSNGQFIFLTLYPGTYYLCASKSRADNGCRSREATPPELFAGFEYGATILI